MGLADVLLDLSPLLLLDGHIYLAARNKTKHFTGRTSGGVVTGPQEVRGISIFLFNSLVCFTVGVTCDRKKVIFSFVLQNKIQPFSKVLSNIKLFLLSLSHTHEVIYAFKATGHLFHCSWTEFSFAEIGQTEALTQIELKRLNVFNSLLGAVHKINPILPLSNSRPQWRFSLVFAGKDGEVGSRVHLSSFYLMFL